MDGPILARIEIFPIKSLDGIVLNEATLLPSGALTGDRQYAILDAQGRFVNGKSNPLIHRIRATFAEDLTTVTLRVQGAVQSETFALKGDSCAPRVRQPLESWFSEYFGQPVTLHENIITGFPDDLNSPAPTLISTATLNAIAQWFPDLDEPEVRRRFRTNLEIANVPPFWEDQLYGEPGNWVQFQLGPVLLLGINPCQRCIVPTRNSLDGSADRKFQSQFGQQRQAQLPDWAPHSRFNHFYKLAVNTRLAADSPGFSLKLSDRLERLSEISAIAG